ncbi:MAG: NAD(P)H-dependent oxidoreductase [Actinomycetota bacterium]
MTEPSGAGPAARGTANTLVVICHPKPTSLTRTAATRVLRGLDRAGQPYRVLDLDELDFDPVLTIEEVQDHLGSPDSRPYLAEHLDALRWCQRLILIYPTWFSGQPARLKGWFDRVWMNEVAFVLPDGANRIRGTLGNINQIDVVTAHGSSRRVNFIQGNSGRIRVNRTLRVLCGLRCRTTWNAIYDIDNRSRAEIGAWLDRVEADFSRRPGGLRRPSLPWLRAGT